MIRGNKSRDSTSKERIGKNNLFSLLLRLSLESSTERESWPDNRKKPGQLEIMNFLGPIGELWFQDHQVNHIQEKD